MRAYAIPAIYLYKHLNQTKYICMYTYLPEYIYIMVII